MMPSWSSRWVVLSGSLVLAVGCQDEGKPEPAPAATATAIVAPQSVAEPDCPVDGLRGEKPVAFCLETAPAGCKLEDIQESNARVTCTNGGFLLHWEQWDDMKQGLELQLKSLEERTSDASTKIFEQGKPKGGEGRFIHYERADQKGLHNSTAVVQGKTLLWSCTAQVSDSMTEDREKFLQTCRTLKEL